MGLISVSRGTLGFSLPWRQPGSRRQVGPRLRSVGPSKKCLPSPHSHLFLLIPVRTRREGGDGGAEPGTPLPGHLLSGSDAGWSAQSPVPLAMHQPTFQLALQRDSIPGRQPFCRAAPTLRGASQPATGWGPASAPPGSPADPAWSRLVGTDTPDRQDAGKHGVEDAQHLERLGESKAHFTGGRAPA